jgi:ribosome-interacting GTPase 1
LISNKSDLDPDPEEVEVLEDLLGLQFPALTVSAETGEGLEKPGPFLFRALEIVRVYTKSPGKPADQETNRSQCAVVIRCWMLPDWCTRIWPGI